jgi:hypothetical protein
MSDFLSSVGSGVLTAIIVAALGISGGATVIVVTGSSRGRAKLGDRLIGTAWIMLIVGLILFGANNGQFTNLAADNVWAMLGADLMGFSIFFWCGGKLARLFF